MEEQQRYHKKLQSLEYRRANKKLNPTKIKYYYSMSQNQNMKPGFYTNIKELNQKSQTQNKNGKIVTITMKTGSVYNGEVNDNFERHGYGEYYVVNGGIYKGQWVNGFKQGQGTFFYRDNQIHYTGQWEIGEPHGYGQVYNQSGQLKYLILIKYLISNQRFEGQFINGKSKEGIYWLDYKRK